MWQALVGSGGLGSGCLILCADTRENPEGKNGVMTDIPRIDGIHCPLRVRCQPLRELRFVQFLEEVYCATLPEFEERKVLLSTPIHFNWVGNRKSLKLAQIAKCVPLFQLWIRCSEPRREGVLEYRFTSKVIRNNM